MPLNVATKSYVDIMVQGLNFRQDCAGIFDSHGNIPMIYVENDGEYYQGLDNGAIQHDVGDKIWIQNEVMIDACLAEVTEKGSEDSPYILKKLANHDGPVDGDIYWNTKDCCMYVCQNGKWVQISGPGPKSTKKNTQFSRKRF